MYDALGGFFVVYRCIPQQRRAFAGRPFGLFSICFLSSLPCRLTCLSSLSNFFAFPLRLRTFMTSLYFLNCWNCHARFLVLISRGLRHFHPFISITLMRVISCLPESLGDIFGAQLLFWSTNYRLSKSHRVNPKSACYLKICSRGECNTRKICTINPRNVMLRRTPRTKVSLSRRSQKKLTAFQLASKAE